MATKGDIEKAEARGYTRGYQAGRKRSIPETVRDDRLTRIAAAIMPAAMRGRWGSTGDDGKIRKYNLHELEDMAVKSAARMADKLGEA